MKLLSKFAIMPAKVTDITAVVDLLSASKLPTEDLPDGLPHFFVVKKDEQLIGAAGVEIHGFYALLRSVAVAADFQGQGIAQELTKKALKEAVKQDVSEVYLITTTADQYFEKQGFTRVERKGVPLEIAQTEQFSNICPSSAIVMKKQL
jgi:N-acetylglutamate synthase-like GNAT family acetyltransferase